MFIQCLQETEEGIRFPGTGVTEGFEPLCGYWELNPGPLQEQPVLSTAEPPPLQPLLLDSLNRKLVNY